MSIKTTKPDMSAIRSEGQAYLHAIEKRGFVLPSLETLHPEPGLAKPAVNELQGFAEPEQKSLDSKQ